MSDVTPPPWWQTLDDEPAKRLARLLADRRGRPADETVLPFVPQQIVTPGGVAVVVPAAALVPLWVLYLDEARQALAVGAEMLAEDTLGPSPERPTLGAAAGGFEIDPAGVGGSSAGTNWYQQRGLADG